MCVLHAKLTTSTCPKAFPMPWMMAFVEKKGEHVAVLKKTRFGLSSWVVQKALIECVGAINFFWTPSVVYTLDSWWHRLWRKDIVLVMALTKLASADSSCARSIQGNDNSMRSTRKCIRDNYWVKIIEEEWASWRTSKEMTSWRARTVSSSPVRQTRC